MPPSGAPVVVRDDGPKINDTNKEFRVITRQRLENVDQSSPTPAQDRVDGRQLEKTTPFHKKQPSLHVAVDMGAGGGSSSGRVSGGGSGGGVGATKRMSAIPTFGGGPSAVSASRVRSSAPPTAGKGGDTSKAGVEGRLAAVESKMALVDSKLDAGMARIEKSLSMIAASIAQTAIANVDNSGSVVKGGSGVANGDASVTVSVSTGDDRTPAKENLSLGGVSSDRATTDQQLASLGSPGSPRFDFDTDRILRRSSTPGDSADANGDYHVAKSGLQDKVIFKGPLVLVESASRMVNPKGKFRLGWDLGVVVPFLLYYACAMPYQICFAAATPAFEVGIDVLFLVDIALNFRTGYFVAHPSGHEDDKGHIEYDRWRVAKNYLTSWFLLDVVSGIPFSLIEVCFASADAGGVSNLKMIKTLKLLRIMKIGRLLKMDKILRNLDRETLDKIGDFFQHGFTRTFFTITYLMLALAYVCHVLACGFVLVGRSGSLEGIPNWLENELKGPFEAADTVQGPSVTSIYIASFYYTLTTMTSVGYGDIITRNNSERIYTIFMEFLGAIAFAMIVAALSRVLTSMDVNTSIKLEQLDAVSSFILLRGFPEDLGRRIRRHFRHFYANKAAINESRIFTELSTSLRKEVSAFLVPELMGSGSFFMKMPRVLWPRLLPLLRPMRYEMHEQVCEQGEGCAEMLIVNSGLFLGSTTVEGEAKPRIRHIANGSSINVLRVLGVWSHCVETVSAEHPSEVYELNAEEFTGLFNGGADMVSIERMQRREVAQFRMHPPDKYSPTQFGRPLYMSCFTTVEMTLLKSRDLLMTADIRKKSTHLYHTAAAAETCAVDHEKWIVAELVSTSTWKPYNNVWHHETQRVFSSSDNHRLGSSGLAAGSSSSEAKMDGSEGEPFWGEEVRWMDVNVPFEQSAVRVRLFETDHKGRAVLMGQTHLKLLDLERKYDATLKQPPPFPPPQQHDQGETPDRERCLSLDSGLTVSKASGGGSGSNNSNSTPALREGEAESWFNLDGSGDLCDSNGDPLPVTSLWSSRKRWLTTEGLLSREHLHLDHNDRHVKAAAMGHHDHRNDHEPAASNTAVKLRIKASRPESGPRKPAGLAVIPEEVRGPG